MMAQIIQTVCDQHASMGEHVEGKTWQVAIKAPGERTHTYTVDLCPDCSKPFAGMLEHLGETGRRVYKPGKAAGGSSSGDPVPSSSGGVAPGPTKAGIPNLTPCPVEGCSEVPVSGQAMRSHLRDKHDMSYARAFNLSEQEAPYGCPDCPDRFTHAQGLAAHRRSQHGA